MRSTRTHSAMRQRPKLHAVLAEQLPSLCVCSTKFATPQIWLKIQLCNDAQFVSCSTGCGAGIGAVQGLVSDHSCWPAQLIFAIVCSMVLEKRGSYSRVDESGLRAFRSDCTNSQCFPTEGDRKASPKPATDSTVSTSRRES